MNVGKFVGGRQTDEQRVHIGAQVFRSDLWYAERHLYNLVEIIADMSRVRIVEMLGDRVTYHVLIRSDDEGRPRHEEEEPDRLKSADRYVR